MQALAIWGDVELISFHAESATIENTPIRNIIINDARTSSLIRSLGMSISRHVLLMFLIAAVCIGIIPAGAQPPIGGDRAWYAVHCNVDGAMVYFDGQPKGEIQGGVLYVEAYTTGTPYNSYTVTKDGYTTFGDSINGVPGKGETFDLYATLNPTQPTQAPVIGGDIGWYTVHSNVDGATVMFDNTYQGIITNGILSVQVYTTGTPYSTYTVTKEEYLPFTSPVTGYPAKGQTVDLYATLNPAPTQVPTKSPLSLGIVVFGIAVAGYLLVSRRS